MESIISRSEMIAYRSNLLQALEELKLRRSESLDRQNVAEKLIAEKLIAEQTLEGKCERLKQAEQTISNLKKKLNEAASKALESKYKDENLQLKVALEAAESTVIALKKDIGMITIHRHQLEVNLKQSEQKAASRDSQVNGLIERLQCLEKAAAKISKQLDDYEETQDLLRKNFDSASSVNKDLVRARTYTECILDNARKEKECLKQKLIESEARCRWSKYSTCSSQLEQDLQIEVKELKKTVDQQKETIQQEQSATERLTECMNALQEELSRSRKIIACSSSDDKSAIELENRLRESDQKARAAASELKSVSESFEKVKMEREKEVSNANEEIAKLSNLLKEADMNEADLQAKVLDLKEAKLTIQELKIQLENLLKTNQCQRDELEERQRKIAEYDNTAKDVNACKMSNSGCQTEPSRISTIEKCCQTEYMNEGKATQTMVSGESTSRNRKEVDIDTTEKAEGTKSSKDCDEIGKERVKTVNQQADPQQGIIHDTTGEKPQCSCPDNSQSNICNADCNLAHKSPPPKLSNHVSSENRCQDQVQSIVSGEIDAKSKCEDRLMFDCAHLHGEDIISSSSQEELSLVNVVEKSSARFKTPFVKKDQIDSDRFCNGSSTKENLANDSSMSFVNHDGSIQYNSTLLKERDLDINPRSLASENLVDDSSATFANSSGKSPLLKENNSDICPKSFAGESLVNDSSATLLNSSGKNQHTSALLKDSVSDILPRPHARKRKLATSPPMFDLSQSSVYDANSSPECRLKQVPLRSLKNFTKKVLSNKPLVKSRPRFTPLSLLSGPSGSLNFSSNVRGRKTSPPFAGLFQNSHVPTSAARPPVQNVNNSKKRFEMESNLDIEIDESD